VASGDGGVLHLPAYPLLADGAIPVLDVLDERPQPLVVSGARASLTGPGLPPPGRGVGVVVGVVAEPDMLCGLESVASSAGAGVAVGLLPRSAISAIPLSDWYRSDESVTTVLAPLLPEVAKLLHLDATTGAPAVGAAGQALVVDADLVQHVRVLVGNAFNNMATQAHASGSGYSIDDKAATLAHIQAFEDRFLRDRLPQLMAAAQVEVAKQIPLHPSVAPPSAFTPPTAAELIDMMRWYRDGTCCR